MSFVVHGAPCTKCLYMKRCYAFVMRETDEPSIEKILDHNIVIIVEINFIVNVKQYIYRNYNSICKQD